MHAAADQALPLYDKMIAVWNDADSVDKLTALAKEIESGKYGVLAKVLAPNVTVARKSTIRCDKNILDAKQKLSATN